MSQIPKTALFLHILTFVWSLFQGTFLGPAVQGFLTICGVPWGLYWATFGSLVGVIFRGFEKEAPRVIRRTQRGGIWAPQGGLKDAT